MLLQPILLSPYRLPGRYPLMFGEEDVAIFLNGYLSLWHPAVLERSASLPRVDPPYDHDNPAAGALFGLPEHPPLFLPDDWHDRAIQAGARWFAVTADFATTLRNLFEALGWDKADAARQAAHLDPELYDWLGLGLGYLVLSALFEAMDHSLQFDADAFWQAIRQALQASQRSEQEEYLRAAARLMHQARDIVYPATVYLVELAYLEDYPEGQLPASLAQGLPTTLVAEGMWLSQRLQTDRSTVERIREAWQRRQADLVCAGWLSRHDALLPVESFLWNLSKGVTYFASLWGQAPEIFGRAIFPAHPRLPVLLESAGLTRALVVTRDGSLLPAFKQVCLGWSGAEGKRIVALVRKPLPTTAVTAFHLAHHLSQTMLKDMTAALVFDPGGRDSIYYRAWLALHRLDEVYGRPVTVSELFTETPVEDYAPAPESDEFHTEALELLTEAGCADPVSRFARHARVRRWLETAWTVWALAQAVKGPEPAIRDAESRLQELEDTCESDICACAENELADLSRAGAQCLAGAIPQCPDSRGWLVVNTCSFARTVVVRVAGVSTPLPAPARAVHVDGSAADVVVGVPALGFVWLPCEAATGQPVVVPHGKLLQEHTLRNEFLEAEVDVRTGGLASLRSPRRRRNLLAQQLVYVPGSRMVMESLESRDNPAWAEIVTQGILCDTFDRVQARFWQTLRVYRGRPYVHLTLRLDDVPACTGYAWYAAFASRFAWRDGSTPMRRGLMLQAVPTRHTRPESGEFIELLDAEPVLILPGGLPFHQKQGSRMLDVLLVTPRETEHTFHLTLGLGVLHPGRAVLDVGTPALAIPCPKPQSETQAWLFHLDAENVILLGMRPLAHRDSLLMRLVETDGVGTDFVLRCPRLPRQAWVVNELGCEKEPLRVEKDSISGYIAGGALLLVRADF
ncbi:MAG: hypothetical protein C4296_05205 [Gemmataceae bacterium]